MDKTKRGDGSDYVQPYLTPEAPAPEYLQLDDSVIARNRPLPPVRQQPTASQARGRYTIVLLVVLVVLVIVLLCGGGYLVWKVSKISSDGCGRIGVISGPGTTTPKHDCGILWRVIEGATMQGGTRKKYGTESECIAACEKDTDCVAADVTGSTCTHLHTVTDIMFSPNIYNYKIIDRCYDFTQEISLAAGNSGLRLSCSGDVMYTRGRVEVYDADRDVWGTVCDDYWDIDDVSVACRQLGLTSSGQKAVGSDKAPFGEGAGPIMLDDVNCTGSEDRLQDCPHSGLYNHSCSHTEDAGIICGPPGPDWEDKSDEDRGIRLADYWCNGTLGRVEYYDRNKEAWGTLCDDKWSKENAQVVCRTLGLSGGFALQVNIAIFGEATTPYTLYDVTCRGTERELLECGHNPLYEGNCSPLEAAAVVCRLSDSAIDGISGDKACRMRYQVYPKLAATGGTTIRGVTDPEVCLQLCAARYICAAFDLNISTKTCTLYTEEQARESHNDPDSMHFKQLEKCATLTYGI